MSNNDHARFHSTFHLARRVLTSCHLSPEYDYSNIKQARNLSALLSSSNYQFSPAEITSIGMMGKIFLWLLENYQATVSPSVFKDLNTLYYSTFSDNQALASFVTFFPTKDIYHSDINEKDFMSSASQSSIGIDAIWKSVILTTIANGNPAVMENDGVFADSNLWNSSPYVLVQEALDKFFDNQPPYQSNEPSLLELLRAPSRAFPHSIQAQLNYIRQYWSHLLDKELFTDLLKALDRLKEEQKRTSTDHQPAQDPIEYARASYQLLSDDVYFSEDLDWMPRVILLAKNVFVWLDQLSRQYQRPIHRLDQIPDEELATISNWGFTGLWLIGIWQRSLASQKIKHLCGNSDAVPSAYSLYDYTIAESLGGYEAYEDLGSRAQSHRIRLAADMVPNHMGIYSKWIAEYPERFLSLDHSPFPKHTFSGPDLSEDPQFSIFLEDHYYDKSDAAVVFKHLDNKSGLTRYIYHGNDGTAMPWNDTAQLDFLRKDVQEAVIQTILDVAKKFPIIRFDAAMTLTKKHYQRLWFPEPGSGGAIPTRVDFALTKSQFNKIMPEEFWRTVVDRVSQDAPDTLLLAEAFWMMEGYFVRTLGMHRVYNSAFMHMLRDEDNAKYRDLINKTLEFDPEILKRYVNFMNNPDEVSAIIQFGDDGKYFGICVLMSTLPGLPMFGHGQVEGYSEKYGMEYQRAYYHELPNLELVKRHEREIFPLLQKRYLFADVSQFVLYDFIDSNDTIIEDVFVYSNRIDTESALIIYHNKWGSVSGNIRRSTTIKGKSLSLFDGLGLNSTSKFILFRDQITNKEYIRSTQDLESNGFNVELGTYQYHVFLDFIQVEDPFGHYLHLHSQLNGKGTSSIKESIFVISHTPLFNAISDFFGQILGLTPNDVFDSTQVNEYLSLILKSLIKTYPSTSIDTELYLKQGSATIPDIVNIQKQTTLFCQRKDFICLTYFLWYLFANLRNVTSHPDWTLFVEQLVIYISNKHDLATYFTDVIPKSLNLLAHLDKYLDNLDLKPKTAIKIWFETPEILNYINVHDYEGIKWFNKEQFEYLVDLSLAYYYLKLSKSNTPTKDYQKKLTTKISLLEKIFHSVLPESGYRLDNYRKIISELPNEATK